MSALQTAKRLCLALGLGPLLVLGFILILSGQGRRGPLAPGRGALMAPLVCGALALLVLMTVGVLIVWGLRRRLLRSPHLAPTLALLKARHKNTTGDGRIKVVPLAWVSDKESIWELDR